MSSKDKFLNELKSVTDRYGITFKITHTNGIPNGTLNNLPNYSISGIILNIPDEDIDICISSKEFVDYVCSGQKM